MPIKSTVNGRAIILEDHERRENEIWSRVMGYYRPVSDWNVGKKEEFKDRVFYKEPRN